MKIDSFEKVLEYSENKGLNLFETFQEETAHSQQCSIENVRDIMQKNLDIMYSTVDTGINDRNLSITGLSGDDSYIILERYKNKTDLPLGNEFGKIIAYAIAIMEENLNMGKIVACPTAGSCGIVPSVIITYAQKYNLDIEKQIDALVTAGGVGKIISKKVALAGAVAGCQAECGVASAMSAAAATYLMGGNNAQILEAVSLALKNTLGLVCDPVAGMVEIPCVKRNGFLAIHGIVASEMALSNVKSAIPTDEVVDAMKQVGILMSPLLKECSQAGLATTRTGLEVQEKLAD